MAIEISVTLNGAADCMVCTAGNVFFGITRAYALELFKQSAGLGNQVVAGVLTLTWIWQLAKGMWGESFDKDILVETTLYCVLAGSLMTQPEPLFDAFYLILSYGLDFTASAFGAIGGDKPDGMIGLLGATEKGLRSAFGPTIDALFDEASIRNLGVVLAALGLLIPVLLLGKHLFHHLITPAFAFFAVACSIYILLILAIFPWTRRITGNGLRVAAAASLQTAYAGIVVSFGLAVIRAATSLVGKVPIESFGNAYFALVLALVFLIMAIPAIMAVPGQLFEVITENKTSRLWSFRRR